MLKKKLTITHSKYKHDEYHKDILHINGGKLVQLQVT